jgi:hypothetical protein
MDRNLTPLCPRVSECTLLRPITRPLSPLSRTVVTVCIALRRILPQPFVGSAQAHPRV